jgi:alpha-tubulin suppressor-like RCC1 family protein
VLAGIAAVAAVALLFRMREGHEHTWLEATCTAPRTCEECGEMQGSALGHSWLEATCTAPRICESCGETEGSALEHSWLEATCTDPRICSVCQKTEGTALGHQWVDATLTAPKTCANCRITSGESKLTTILAEAEQYAAEREYRQAIELLDNAWAEYGEKQFYDLAADYRTEFGIYNTSMFAVGKHNTILLNANGRVEICGDETHGEYKAGNWTNIVAVSAGDRHVVGLTKYGTVVAEGNNVYDECEVAGWSNIIAISAGDVHTVALSKNGTVYATGYNHEGQCDVNNLMRDAGNKKIVTVAAGYVHTLALLEDGRVVACGGNSFGETNVYGWEDIVAICTGTQFSAGLKADGTVVVTGKGTSAWDLSDWTDIVNLAAGDYYLIGVKANGDVLSSGINSADNPSEGQTNVSGMRDIVFAGAGNDHTVFLDSDGVLWCIGSNEYGQCNFHGRVLK